MKLLALTVGGYQIQLPGQVQTVNNQAGKFGINIFRLAVDLLILAAVLLTLFFIIYGGFKWMTSRGDKKIVEEAQHTLVWSILGLIVVILAFFVINIFGAFFNVPLLTIQ